MSDPNIQLSPSSSSPQQQVRTATSDAANFEKLDGGKLGGIADANTNLPARLDAPQSQPILSTSDGLNGDIDPVGVDVEIDPNELEKDDLRSDPKAESSNTSSAAGAKATQFNSPVQDTHVVDQLDFRDAIDDAVENTIETRKFNVFGKVKTGNDQANKIHGNLRAADAKHKELNRIALGKQKKVVKSSRAFEAKNKKPGGQKGGTQDRVTRPFGQLSGNSDNPYDDLDQ